MRALPAAGKFDFFRSVMHESVRWLIGKGKVERATDILRVIAKRNGRQVEDEVYRGFEVR